MRPPSHAGRCGTGLGEAGRHGSRAAGGPACPHHERERPCHVLIGVAVVTAAVPAATAEALARRTATVDA
ncbi:hypothetical protein ACWEWI_36285 [Streptomyces sp. NPDC003753]|uniref:hypothetical protein n=1 Tax=unclassified Streptomyces TaxID=2593676 RepID=UPI0019047858|nr:hypothetical protein [Streptomyces sp. Y2F8-2]